MNWDREEGEILSWCVGETALGNIEKPLYLLGFKYPRHGKMGKYRGYQYYTIDRSITFH